MVLRRTIDMDNLKIYIDTNDLIKIKGKMRDLKEGELIQARLMKSNLMLSITDNPELFNEKFMYFKSLESLTFYRLVTNYLYYKETPGIVLTNINGTYYHDGELDEEFIKNEIEDLGELGSVNGCNKNVEVETISDLLYASNDYNPEQEHIASEEFLVASDNLDNTIYKIKTALGADIVQKLDNNICEVIKLMNMNQFKLGYSLALEYLADLSSLPGNTIAERVKAELEE